MGFIRSSIRYNVVIRITQPIRTLVLVAAMLAAGALALLTVLAVRMGRESLRDDARPADVILVMGAAEYRGRPSTVLKRRLDHAVELYRQNLAPYVLATGGAGGDPVFTEGGVSRSYLIDRGVPAESVIVEDEGGTTAYSLAAVVEILRSMGLHSCIVVSDGYHVYRVKRILQLQGFTVYTSPREPPPSESESISAFRRAWLLLRQAVAYAMWRVGLRF
jgi:uncharacterized SAM-binding protein YcdF (DUF218 family)